MVKKKPDPQTEKTKQLTLRIPEDLHRKLKIAAAEEGRSMGEIAEDLFREYVRKKK